VKIIHTTDLHLRLAFIDTPIGHRASEERRLDFLGNLDRMVNRGSNISIIVAH
jgi:DNA repair exonuclease SbcCD nuclease subunit